MESSKIAGQGEETGSRYDTILLVAALVLLVGGMVIYYVFVPQLSKLPRLLILLGGIAAAVAVVYQTMIGKTLWAYVQGSRVELRKVVWPSRQESLQTTLVIAVFVVLIALLMWGLDSALLYGVGKLTGRGA
jgi:preprotein translocase subunit SecE